MNRDEINAIVTVRRQFFATGAQWRAVHSGSP